MKTGNAPAPNNSEQMDNLFSGRTFSPGYFLVVPIERIAPVRVPFDNPVRRLLLTPLHEGGIIGDPVPDDGQIILDALIFSSSGVSYLSLPGPFPAAEA